MKKEQKGITLIALIITIIILLILAGVTINLILGENGLFGTAKQAAESYDEAGARERLEVVLASLQADKYTNLKYDEQTDINNRITENNMNISGNIVIVDGWNFEIDRSVPKIVASLGKGKESSDITIDYEIQYLDDYSEANIRITINSAKELKTIKINNENVIATNNNDGTYTIEKTITENGTYNVYVKDIIDEYKTKDIRVIGFEQDTTIWTAEELKEFADLVNSGRRYVEKTITLGKDIDLSSICHEESETNNRVSWTPIGTETKPFKGTFDGNNKTINGLYINSNSANQALFGFAEGGIFKDLNISGVIKNSRK